MRRVNNREVVGEGFSVRLRNRDQIEYREGDRVGSIDFDSSVVRPRNVYIYASTFTRWNRPHNLEDISTERWRQILSRIKHAMEILAWDSPTVVKLTWEGSKELPPTELKATYACRIAAADSDGVCADAVGTFVVEDRLVVAVADGAGGTGGGGDAARRLVEQAARGSGHLLVPDHCVAFLAAADETLHPSGAETTGVVLTVHDGWVSGASVGDSAAWIIREGGRIEDLTTAQGRKPLVGSGRAKPAAFDTPFEGTLLAGTDGLFKYAPAETLARIAAGPNLEAAADALLAAPRLPNGSLQDDVGLVLVRTGLADVAGATRR